AITTLISGAISRILDPEPRGHRRPAAGSRRHIGVTAGQPGPLHHPHDAERPSRSVGAVAVGQALPVVLDPHLDPPAGAPDRDACLARTRVLDDVADGFLRDSEDVDPG